MIVSNVQDTLLLPGRIGQSFVFYCHIIFIQLPKVMFAVFHGTYSYFSSNSSILASVGNDCNTIRDDVVGVFFFALNN